MSRPRNKILESLKIETKQLQQQQENIPPILSTLDYHTSYLNLNSTPIKIPTITTTQTINCSLITDTTTSISSCSPECSNVYTKRVGITMLPNTIEETNISPIIQI